MLHGRLQLSVRLGVKPESQLARVALVGLYPRGLAAETQQSVIGQFTSTQASFHRIDSDDELRSALKTLGHLPLLDEIRTLNERYGTVLNVTHDPVPTYQEERDADDLGWSYFASIVAIISGAYPDDTNPDHVASRTKLLAPVVKLEEQDQARRRRGPRAADAGVLETEDPSEDPSGEMDDDVEGDCEA